MQLIIFVMIICFCSFDNFGSVENFSEKVKEKAGTVKFSDEERKIFSLINVERGKKGLGSLYWNSRLADLARSYSQKMARESYFSHYDRSGNSLSGRAKMMGLTGWKRLGENLFMIQNADHFSDFAVKAWMKSPGHRGNILQGSFNQTGVGIARSRNGAIFITQVFLQS